MPFFSKKSGQHFTVNTSLEMIRTRLKQIWKEIKRHPDWNKIRWWFYNRIMQNTYWSTGGNFSGHTFFEVGLRVLDIWNKWCMYVVTMMKRYTFRIKYVENKHLFHISLLHVFEIHYDLLFITNTSPILNGAYPVTQKYWPMICTNMQNPNIGILPYFKCILDL